MNNTFSAEDLGKAFILRDDIERKNIRTYTVQIKKVKISQMIVLAVEKIQLN